MLNIQQPKHTGLDSLPIRNIYCKKRVKTETLQLHKVLKSCDLYFVKLKNPCPRRMQNYLLKKQRMVVCLGRHVLCWCSQPSWSNSISQVSAHKKHQGQCKTEKTSLSQHNLHHNHHLKILKDRTLS